MKIKTKAKDFVSGPPSQPNAKLMIEVKDFRLRKLLNKRKSEMLKIVSLVEVKGCQNIFASALFPIADHDVSLNIIQDGS